MTELVYGKEITFRQHVLNIEYFTKMIDDLDSIVKSELALLDKSLCGVDTDRDSFALISCCLSECFDVFKVSDCIGKELQLAS
jgi:hypothetical protein